MNSKKLFSFLLVASIMLTGCGGNDKTATSSEPSDTQKTAELTIDKNGKKEESKDTDSKKQEKETSSSTKNETNSSKNKTSTNDSKDSGNKPAENSKPSKPANSGAMNKPSKPSKPAPSEPAKPAPSKPNKPAPAPSEPAKPSKPAHQHDWKTEYKTVHHEAQYRNEPVYEDQIVYEDRPVYKWQAYWTCTECGKRFETEYDAGDHALFECGGGYSAHEEKIQTGTEQVQVGTNKVQIGTNPVLVKEAWDEKVPNGQSCSCGARK